MHLFNILTCKYMHLFKIIFNQITHFFNILYYYFIHFFNALNIINHKNIFKIITLFISFSWYKHHFITNVVKSLIHIFFVSNLCFSAMINYFNAKCVTLIFLRNISINLRNPTFILRNKITSILSYKIKKCYLIIFQ